MRRIVALYCACRGQSKMKDQGQSKLKSQGWQENRSVWSQVCRLCSVFCRLCRSRINMAKHFDKSQDRCINWVTSYSDFGRLPYWECLGIHSKTIPLKAAKVPQARMSDTIQLSICMPVAFTSNNKLNLKKKPAHLTWAFCAEGSSFH